VKSAHPTLKEWLYDLRLANDPDHPDMHSPTFIVMALFYIVFVEAEARREEAHAKRKEFH